MIDRDRLSARVEELEPELDALVADLVAIDSQIPPYADERAVVAHLRQQGEARGLGAGEVMAAAPERPNLVLRVDGNPDGRRLGLCGHVDTKPVGDAAHLWRTDPLVATEIDGMLYGLGTSDMKAAVAAMVIAAQACVEAGITEHGSLELALVADEEAGAQFGSKWLAPQLTHWDGCLIGEPSGWERDWQGLHLVSRGLSCFRITVLGTQRHSSLSDRLPAVNASMQLATLMSRMPSDLVITHPSQQFDDLRPTVNPGVMINGGVYYGVVPGEAMFACDIRAVPGMTLESLTEDLHAWLERAEQELGIEARLEFEPDLTWWSPRRTAVPACWPIRHRCRSSPAPLTRRGSPPPACPPSPRWDPGSSRTATGPTRRSASSRSARPRTCTPTRSCPTWAGRESLPRRPGAPPPR